MAEVCVTVNIMLIRHCCLTCLSLSALSAVKSHSSMPNWVNHSFMDPTFVHGGNIMLTQERVSLNPVSQGILIHRHTDW